MTEGSSPPKRHKIALTNNAEYNQHPNDMDVHEAFTTWCQNKGIVINGVKASRIPNRGMGLVTTKPLKTNERVVLVPDSAMFKPNIALIKREQKLQRLPSSLTSQAQLAVSLLAADRRSDDGSELSLWSRTWPEMADFESGMPLFWREDVTRLLTPSLSQALQRQKKDFDRDVHSTAAFIAQATESGDRAKFQYYWAIVNSRSFHYKPPGARPGFPVLCPFMDYLNHTSGGNGAKVFQSPRGYEVVADRDYEIGEEMTFTYGSHSDEKLLLHYGFMCTIPPGVPSDDDISLDHIILPKLSDAVKQQLQERGYLGSFALLPVSSEVCFKTQVAVRAVLLSTKQWEYFIANGEDRGEDLSPAVGAWLRPLLKAYRIEAEGMLDRITAEKEHQRRRHQTDSVVSTRTAVEILSDDQGKTTWHPYAWTWLRWNQVLAALKAYDDA